ncbi:hypothetical protein, partial [Azospirillum sp. B506]|uniref:hypothetical protein n=1 Tax=Azospirillum sp. B506 TaxID=137721 RepID=UPI001B3B82AA
MPEPAADPDEDPKAASKASPGASALASPKASPLGHGPPASGSDSVNRRALCRLHLPVTVPILALVAGVGLSLLAMVQSERLLHRE